eukprot:3717290-Amphidinium_carterae.1
MFVVVNIQGESKEHVPRGVYVGCGFELSPGRLETLCNRSGKVVEAQWISSKFGLALVLVIGSLLPPSVEGVYEAFGASLVFRAFRGQYLGSLGKVV